MTELHICVAPAKTYVSSNFKVLELLDIYKSMALNITPFCFKILRSNLTLKLIHTTDVKKGEIVFIYYMQWHFEKKKIF